MPLVFLAPMTGTELLGELALLVGDGGSSRVNLGGGTLSLLFGDDVLFSSSTVYDWFNLLGEAIGVYVRPGELPGVVGRPCVGGEFGVDGRRNGEARGEPNERGDGLNGGLEGILGLLAGDDDDDEYEEEDDDVEGVAIPL